MKASLTGSRTLHLTHNPCLNKFPQDQINDEDSLFHVLVEGYILNHQALAEAYPGLRLGEIIWQAYQGGGMPAVLNLLRGSFVLALEDKLAGKTYLANDMLSKKPLFYLLNGESLLVDTSFLSLVADAKAAGLPLTISQTGIAEMIQRCSFLGSDTYTEEIRFLERFQYLCITSGGVTIENYEYTPTEALPEDEDALLQRIDRLFTEACAMAVQKNQLRGYRQVFTLSAGMDSRCSFLKCIPLCQSDAATPLCLTYGASGCMELQIASALAHAQGCDLLMHEINPTGFIRDRETILDRNEGMMYYAGTTGLTRLLRSLDTTRYGLVITGLGGGEIMGDLGRFGEDAPLYDQLFKNLIIDDATRQTRLEQLKAIPYNDYVCYQDIRTCHNFAYTTCFDFETFSPFLYEDLFLLLLRVPQESKSFRRLYAKWYLKYIGDPTPTSCFQGPVEVTTRTSPKQLVKGGMRRLRRMLRIQGKWDMNPIEVWVKQYPENRSYMEDTLTNDLAVIRSQAPKLAEQLQQEYLSADADTKLRILTASGMVKRIISK